MSLPVLGYEYFTLDVFTDQRFGGNPLAVVLEADKLSGEQMQQIAGEFNLSETVFVHLPKDSGNTARLRIFTPARELPFAGHPTIGTAMLLADLGSDLSKPLVRTIKLEEEIGLVCVDVTREPGKPIYGELTAAQLPKLVDETPDNDKIAAALGVEVKDVGFGLHRPSIYDAGNAPLFVPLSSREAVSKARAVSVNWQGLGKAGRFGTYIYCRGPAESNQFHARFFAPEAGIIEDPATGSAAVAFAGALNKALVLEDGSHSWQILQGFDMGRPSQIDLNVEVRDSELTKVLVGGNSVRVARGVLTV